MGTEVAWVPLVLSLVSAGATAYETNRVAKKQDSALAQSINDRGKRQREADAKVNELVTATGASTPQEERRDALAQYSAQLAKHGGSAAGALQPISGASEKYRQDAADASLGVSQFGQQFADLMSQIDAPVRQRVNEAQMRSQFGTDIDEISRRSKGQDFLEQLKLQGIRRNPWVDAGAGALSGAASGMGSGGGGWTVNAGRTTFV